MKKSFFIAFEGIDGSGKTTQIFELAKYLFRKNKKNNILLTREPYKDERIRELLTKDKDPYKNSEKLANLFIEDRRIHLKELILPSLKKGIHVISDRFSFSTLAYQQAQGIPLSTLIKMHKGIIIPDAIFIIDVPVEVALRRIKKDKERNREIKFEKDIDFLKRIRENYLKLAFLPKHKVFVIDGNRKKEEVFEEIKMIIHRNFFFFE
ncbi:MAG: dTMP kinase [Candidatus Pacearchaeota archaeon]